MVVLLWRPDEIPSPNNYDAWASIGDSPDDLPTEKRDTALGANLEKTFDEIAEVWMEIGRALSAEPERFWVHDGVEPNSCRMGKRDALGPTGDG